ncbi:MAG: hypothetical protein M1830_005722 [Pleopsidium flavum]|nr:MAG: hypothetical protein M1830_005722 [Pleopsidium flavum]
MSDTFDMKEVDGIVYEIEARKVTKGGERIDIGANPSTENQDEGGDLDDKVEQELDIVVAFRLHDMEMKAPQRKSHYIPHIKAYMKKVVEALKAKGTDEETIKAFQTGAQAYVKKIIANITDYDFYIGESQDFDGMHVLLNYREDGITPYFTIWKHGLTEMKV